MKTITGYSDKISVRPGKKCAFKINSAKTGSYEAQIVRVIHGDTNPKGPGYKDEAIPTDIDGSYPGRKQKIYCGSYVVIATNLRFESLRDFTVQAMIWPTIPGRGRQSLLAHWNNEVGSGFRLDIDESGAIALVLANGNGKIVEIGGGKALISREWYFVGASYDTSSAEVCVYQEPLILYPGIGPSVEIHKIKNFDGIGQRSAPLIIAAHNIETIGDKMIVCGHYNSKIDSPRLSNRALNRHEIEALLGNPSGEQIKSSVVGAWDFSLDIESETVSDISPNQLHCETINLPT